MAENLLTTGQVATLLGCSRQHVVDLCDTGTLAHQTVGTHRRVLRSDAEQLSNRRLTRDQERLLWLHIAVAGRLVADPDGVLSRAETNLVHLYETHARGRSRQWLDRWRETLDDGMTATLDALTSRSALACELRQNSPFSGVLETGDRQAVLAAFRAEWQRMRRR